jgi:hypothetical protein
MKKKAPAAGLAATLLFATVCARAQEKPADKPAAQSQPAAAATAPSAAASAKTPVELARATYSSLGGDKYRDLKNMVLTGSAELFSPDSTQTLPGKFGMITAGEKMRMELQSPLFSVSLVSDGVTTYSSMRQFQMPPPNKYGLTVLMKYDQSGYAVTALPDKKKERAFRVTDPEGNATDFYVDAATGRLLRFEVPYGVYTYSFEFKTVKEMDGVTVPASFVMRLSTGQGSFFAEFKVKDAKLNQTLPEDAFAIPNK